MLPVEATVHAKARRWDRLGAVGSEAAPGSGNCVCKRPGGGTGWVLWAQRWQRQVWMSGALCQEGVGWSWSKNGG